jgi:hypothetical protein
MVMSKAIALAIAGAIGCAALPVVAQNGGAPIFIPPNARDKDDRHGEHYDTVVANYTRRCTSLDGQFSRLRAHMGLPIGLWSNYPEGRLARAPDSGMMHRDRGEGSGSRNGASRG